MVSRLFTSEDEIGQVYTTVEHNLPLVFRIIKSRVIYVETYHEDWWERYSVRTRDTLIASRDYNYLLTIF